MALGPTPPATTTEPIREAWHDVYVRWGSRVDSLGTFACRRIFGRPAPAPWSEHAWGNAWDIGGPTEVLDQVARFLARQPYAAQVLWRRRDLVTGHAVEDHDHHVHLSGYPLRAVGGAVPPCAQGAPTEGGGWQTGSPIPLPAAARTVAGETWAEVARASARELAEAARRIGRAAGALRDIMGGR